MTKHICVITNGYPTKEDPVYAFIQPLVWQFADLGYKCTVIAPQSITSCLVKRNKLRTYRWIDSTPNGNKITVFQPKYISISDIKLLGQSISIKLRDNAIKHCFSKEQINADVMYAHFWDCGIAAAKIAKFNNIPVYVASGESKIRVFDYYSKKNVLDVIKQIKGVICVSKKNLEESDSLGLLIKPVKTVVIPNAVNPCEFYPMDKCLARTKLGYSIDDKIAIFVGAFSERKGANRTVSAVESVNGLKLIMIGSGEQNIKSDSIIFSGRVPHSQIIYYLNSADVFVLPTTAEGCCNAIVEALACGVPIVSSDMSFNDDILNVDNSIRINPYDVNEISNALSKIINDKMLLSELSKGAEMTGKELSIIARAEKILEFMSV